MDRTHLMHFLSGAFMTACLVSAMFFYRFWKKTGDKLFFIFSFAFVLLGVERIGFLIINAAREERTYVYFIRLAAFVLIIIGILNKNRPSGD